MRILRALAAAAALPLILGACDRAGNLDERMANANQTILELAANTPELSTLRAAIEAADLADRFGERRQVTVFAPTDAAFAKLGLNAENIAAAFTKEELVNILTYHVTPGVRVTKWLADAKGVVTKQGSSVRVSGRSDSLILNKSRITTADLYATNGILHLIDTVLIPPAE